MAAEDNVSVALLAPEPLYTSFALKNNLLSEQKINRFITTAGEMRARARVHTRTPPPIARARVYIRFCCISCRTAKLITAIKSLVRPLFYAVGASASCINCWHGRQRQQQQQRTGICLFAGLFEKRRQNRANNCMCG